MATYLKIDQQQNSSNHPIVAVDATQNLVYSDSTRNITLLGVNDLLIVQTGDALLICPRERAEQVKQLIPHLPSELH